MLDQRNHDLKMQHEITGVKIQDLKIQDHVEERRHILHNSCQQLQGFIPIALTIRTAAVSITTPRP